MAKIPTNARKNVLRALLALVCLLPALSFAQGMFGGAQPPRRNPAALMQDIGIDQKLNQHVPLNLAFRDENGNAVELARYFGEKPVLLTLVYYSCPMLCNEVLRGVSGSLKGVPFTAGEEFNIVTVSIDPNDGPKQAAEKRTEYLARYGRPAAARGWHFLTGDQQNIEALARAVGFRYRYDAARQQYIHAAGIMLLTPDGRLSRYFYGVEFAPRDLKLGLMEASQSRIGTLADAILLLCYHYDPTVGKYTPLILNLVRAGGVLTVVILGTFIGAIVRRERKNRRAA